MQGLTVCVNYDDLLALTLPFNARHFDRIILATTPGDEATANVARQHDNIEIVQTDVFYARGADFNRGAAIEEASLRLDPKDWTVIFDCDVVMPRTMALEDLDPEVLYVPWRVSAKDRAEFERVTASEPFDFTGLSKVPDWEFAGYFQLFHPSASVLQARPWYGLDWRHAGGSDSDFQLKFAFENRHRLDFQVLHLGPAGNNWYGRATPRWTADPGSPRRLPPEVADLLQTKMYMDRRREGGVGKNERIAE